MIDKPDGYHTKIKFEDKEDGKLLLTYLAGARVPMPKSTRAFLDHCQLFRSRRRARAAAVR